MGEDELEEYLNQIHRLREHDYGDPLREQLVDDDGSAVPGCYRIMPALPES